MKTRKTDRITQELRRIAQANGGILLPEKVVAAARPKASPLHSRFCWDDTKAAEQYRIWQARMLIRVTVNVVPETGLNERVWVSLKPDSALGAGYRSMVDVLSDDDMRAQLLQDALADAALFQEKYLRLNELAEVFAAMEQVTKKLQGRRSTASRRVTTQARA